EAAQAVRPRPGAAAVAPGAEGVRAPGGPAAVDGSLPGHHPRQREGLRARTRRPRIGPGPALRRRPRRGPAGRADPDPGGVAARCPPPGQRRRHQLGARRPRAGDHPAADGRDPQGRQAEHLGAQDQQAREEAGGDRM
ncbi:MAG: hypothetical protein AVDCRST_MAG47-50, partial [uncultured Nocardioidaceae bacterium]